MAPLHAAHSEISPDFMVTNAKPAYIELNLEPMETKLDEVVIRVSPFERKYMTQMGTWNVS